jgi:hypothetical protein
MSKKNTLLLVSLFCFSSLIFAKKSLTILTEESTTKLEIILDETYQVSTLDSKCIDTALTTEKVIFSTEIKAVKNAIKGLPPVSKGWAIGLNYGFTQFRGDIKENSFFKSTSFSNSYSLEIQKPINPLFKISAEVIFGNLTGLRDASTYSLSKSTTANVHDPYELYLENGEIFDNSFVEYDLKFCFDIERLIKKHYSSFNINKKFSLFYNFCVGLNMFRSIKRNLNAKSEIYAYGYDYVNGNFEMNINRARSRVLQYGFSISYNLIRNIDIQCSSIMRVSDSDYLDSSSMNSQPQNDRFRVISFGIIYDFGKVDEIVD